MKMLPVALLAGGLGTRLGVLTDGRPKSLIEVAGQPFVAHQLRLLARQGVERVVLCIGHFGEMVRQFVGDGRRFGVDVEYALDGDTALGTGGALRQALPLLGERFFVMYGDSYLRAAMRPVQEAFLASGAPALMCVLRNQDRWDRSNVVFGAHRVVKYSKRDPTPAMHYIDYGLSILSAEAWSRAPQQRSFDLADLLEALACAGQLAGYEVFERFYEVGSVRGIEALNVFLTSGEPMTYTQQHLREASEILDRLDVKAIEQVAALLARVRGEGGRLFFLGVGGSAGNCSHAVNDFRKIVGIESYAPTDNVSELTARTNDEGWASVFVEWLRVSRLERRDCVFVFSVGGGDLEKNISPNLVEALKFAESVGAAVTGVVGRNGGYTARVADACVIIPTVNAETVTPHAEAFQAVIWHLLVSHPSLKANQTKWESAAR
jgi:D-sedoheptulose 7-phosphate isomerase